MSEMIALSLDRPSMETSSAPLEQPSPQIVDTPLEQLVQLLCAKDENALSQLYDQTVGKVFAVARLMMGNTEDAEEVSCDVYTQVWQSAWSYDVSRGSVMNWLLTICRSRALDMLRRKRVRQRTSERAIPLEQATFATAELSPEDFLSRFQEGTAVHQALAALTSERREVLALAYYRGMTHQEIAGTVQLPIGTVKSHIRRALQTLREHLES